MIQNRSDITINITAHGEGVLLYKTLQSVWRNYQYAKVNGVRNIQFNLGLDRATPETSHIAKEFAKTHKGINIINVDEGDLGKHRNYLLKNSNGRYIAFFDGDDFFSENYLLEAYNQAEKSDKPAVYIPEYIIYFEGHNLIKKSLDSNSPDFHIINLVETNYFIATNFVDRRVYDIAQYDENNKKYGMEDWFWNTLVLNKGVTFNIVPGTLFFYRIKKKGSLLNQNLQNSTTLRKSPLFEGLNFADLPTYEISQPIKLGSKSKLKNTVKQVMHKFMRRDGIPYRYLKDSYQMHRGYASAAVQSFRNKGIKPGVIGVDPEIHSVIIPDDGIPDKLKDIGITTKHLQEWAKINSIEPLIRPSWGMLNRIEVSTYLKESLIGVIYHNICSQYGGYKYTDLFIIPHLIRGGADLAIINTITGLASDKSRRIMVISTEDVDSPWANRISNLENVTLLESNNELRGLNEDQLKMLISRIVINWNFKRVSIINSIVGYHTIESYGQAMSDHAKIYMYTYAYDMTPDGFLFNVIPNGLVDLYDVIDHYFTDCMGYKNQLETVNGFSHKKIDEVYLPVTNQSISAISHTKATKKVLWASRISPAKIIEVAVEVGSMLKEHGIELHFYGTMDDIYEMGGVFKKMIQPYDNIYYHGVYDGFSSIDLDNYDIFLLTSKNEGMPNVALEAIMANLYIVAPPVGGLPEIIKNEKNGELVNDKFSAASYAQAIIKYYKNDRLHNLSNRKKVNLEVLSKHSWEEFINRLNKFY